MWETFHSFDYNVLSVAALFHFDTFRNKRVLFGNLFHQKKKIVVTAVKIMAIFFRCSDCLSFQKVLRAGIAHRNT